MNHDELDQQIRIRVHDVTDGAPEPAPFPSAALQAARSGVDSQPISGRSPRLRLAAAAVLLIVAIAAGTWMTVGRADRMEVASDAGDSAQSVEVIHEVVRYSQSYELDCPDGPVERSGQFDEMTFETWGSNDLARWKQTITYPDGSSRTLLHTDNPWYPTDAFASGEPQGQTIGCGATGILLAEPSQGDIYTLNPLAPIPDALDGMPRVPQYNDLGEQVPGDHIGPSGQPVELWRQSIEGFRTVGTEQVGLLQVKEWLVDPTISLVVEESFEDALQGVGTTRWTATLETYRTETVDQSLFDSDGMERQPDRHGDGHGRTFETPTTMQPSD